MNTVFLRLEAPLQSWGLRAHWEERDSAAEPTKSGVIGLIGCALGLPRSSPHLRELSDSLRMGVRVDREGAMLIDYHTTGGGFYQDAGYDGSGGWTHTDPYIGGVLSAKLAAEGRIKIKINDGTKLPETDVSYRHYLMDASFLAAVQGDPALVTEIAAALQRPVFPVFLGRKACVPSLPVFAGTGEYADLRSALLDWAEDSLRAVAERAADQLRLIVEALPGQGRRQYDLIGAPAQRRFLPRYVAESYAERAAAPLLNTLEG
jgi:CRISPR system Cascade subunit CasD